MIRRQGFSLAEALITLVILSLVMAATMPIVIKSQGSPSEAPFKYVTQGDLVQNAAVYSALGATSTVLFGDKRVPIDSNVTTNKDYVFATKLNPKISIVARNRASNPLISRHLIDFYEKETNGNHTSIGKVSFDQFFNLSLGLNAMDSIKSTSSEPQLVALEAATDSEGYDWADLKENATTGVVDTTLSRGAANTAVGQYAMGGDSRYNKATGTSGSYVDFPTKNMIGIGNTALGAFALRRHQNGNLNTGIGAYSLQSASSDIDGTAYSTATIGSGSYNSALGAYTLKYNSSGSLNSVLGTYAMLSNSTGSTNTALGSYALSSNTTGSSNIVIGSYAGAGNTEGSYNIMMGYYTGATNTTGRGNIIIGNNIMTAAGENNKLYIGGVTNEDNTSAYNDTNALIYGDMAAQTLTLNTKTITLGNSDTSAEPSVTYIKGVGYIQKDGTPYQIATIQDITNYLDKLNVNITTGDVTYTSPTTIYSDARLKNIIGDNKAGLKEIMQIQVKNYTMKRDKKKEVLVGVIAQELQKVFPNSVAEGRDGYLRIRRDEIFYACINAIKELNNMFKDLVAKVVGLDEKIRLLEDRNKLNETKIAELERQNKLFEERLLALENQNAKKTITKQKDEKTEASNPIERTKTEVVQ